MNTYKIYTAGKMFGLSFANQMEWRCKLESLISERKCSGRVIFVHPPLYYNYNDKFHQNEAEVMAWELSQIKDSDIVVVDLSRVSQSVGTLIELGVALANHKHIIGVGKPDTNHPWINLACLRCEESLEKAAGYIAEYLLL